MRDEKNERKQRGARPKDGVVMPAPPTLLQLPEEYPAFFKEIKQSITQRHLKTIHQVNTDMLLLYWHIGQRIKIKQKEHDWGAKVIDRLSNDLKNAFPDIKGFSPRSLKYMVKFSVAWPDITIVQQVAAQFPWGTNMLILDKLNSDLKYRGFRL